VVIFDPQIVTDVSTSNGSETGVEYLLVGGAVLVKKES
jgi:hypothetical protein